VSRFLLFFFVIYGGAHIYAFLKARAAFDFGLRAGVPIALFMLLMFLAPVIVRFAEGNGLALFARLFSYAGYVWLGLLFLFFSASLTVDIYRIVLRLGDMALGVDPAGLIPSAKSSFYLPLAFSLIASFYGYFEARDIRVERLAIETAKLPEAVDRLRIVQISDVHLGLIVRADRLRMILEEVKKAGPDILVSTGDLVDGQINGLPGLADMFLEINPKYGKYAITGNHEFYAGLPQALDFTERAGFKVLRGEALSGVINIAGVDDPTGRYFGLLRDVPETDLLAGLPGEKFTLLLKHRPFPDKDAVGLFDLQLSGHTHKGQIFPFNIATRLYFPRHAGRMDLGGGSAMYVSRGSGTWGPPVRVLSPPEVTVIDLVRTVTPPG
jgi:predicted MPP superfamily phosphohydrolase